MSPPALAALVAEKLAARLGVTAQSLDTDASFNALGLDSAGAVGLVSELAGALGRPLSPTLVWAYPTPAELARYLGGASEAKVFAEARSTAEPIAVVGMACRFPGAPDLDSFWRLLVDGVDATTEVPRERWNPSTFYHPDPEHPGTTNTRRGGFLEHIDLFDPLFFGISPREAAEMDPQQRLMLELSWEALEDAGIPPRSLAGTKAGVFFGVVWRDYAEIHRAAGAAATPHTGVGQGVAIVANRVSYLFGLKGPSLVIDTACSSSLVAAHLACQSLRAGECGVALVGGVNLTLVPETMVALTKFGGLSGEGRCKAFDARADGFARGEGAGVVVLKPLTRALADGDPVYCLLRGGAVNNDGASNGLTAPNPRAQVEVLEEAYARTGVDPSAVQYVEAHGTGTPLGDPIEARALSEVLCRNREEPLRIGSVKTNVGHLEAAAGIAGLIKLALCLRHRTIPPSLHFERPNPDIPFGELKLAVQTAVGPWPAGHAVGGVSSFGWGGTNCHLVLEELEGPREPAAPPRFVKGDEKIAFVFSGIGAQWRGMGLDLLRSEPLFRARVEACDRVLAPLLGWSLVEELIAGDRWQRVDVAVPALYAVEVALADLWRSWGVEPDLVLGHSVGEFAAAYVAGALTLDEGARVAFHYSRLLARIAGQVGLGVVQLGVEKTVELLEPELEIAGDLSPESTLVAGPPEPLDPLLAAVARRGLFSARVVSDVASHCRQVEPLLRELCASLADLSPRKPRTPMVSTVTGEPVSERLDDAYWGENLRRPVRFAPAVARAREAGCNVFLEVDPHPILAAPLAQCGVRGLASLRRGESGRAGMLAALGELAGKDGKDAKDSKDAELLVLSARSAEALAELAGVLPPLPAWERRAGEVRAGRVGESLADLAWTAAMRRSHHEVRAAVVARSRGELAEKLAAMARGESAAGVAMGRSGRGEQGVVFVFSGQGPQRQGMGRELLAGEPVFRAAVERCDELFEPYLGGSLLARVERDPESLDHTAFAQPALFALQVGLAELWRSWGIVPAAVVGHSVGEVAAAQVAGIYSLAEAVRVAVVRGRAMEPARGRGGMAAVELPEEEVVAKIADLGLEIAAVNGPSSTVVAGAPAALDEAATRFGSFRRLHVEYAFHTAQMEPFDAEVEAALAELTPRTAVIPMVSAVTGKALNGPELDGAYWRRNVRRPVRFRDAMAALAGHSVFLEIGPHPVLASSIAECAGDATVLASLRRGRNERETMLEALGGLYCLGLPIDWRGVFPDGGRLVRLPTYPFQRQRYWFTAGEAPQAAPLPASGDGEVERILAAQLDAFQRMVAMQLSTLGDS